MAPIAILAIWGGSYIRACVLILSVPNRPVEVSYPAGAGVMRVRAESFWIDWDRGTAGADHLRWFEPSGRQVASAFRVTASGISLPFRGAISARVSDVQGTITRLRSGRFDIQEYLLPRTGPPSKIPFAVTINRAIVVGLDLSGPKPFRQFAIARDIDVRGVGDSWVASGYAELPGMGNVRGEVQGLPNEGYLVKGITAGLQLAPLLAHLKQTPDVKRFTYLADLSATSLVAYGPVGFFIPKSNPFQLQGNVRATGENLGFRQYEASHLEFNGVVTESEARGVLSANQGGTSAKIDGAMSWKSGVTFGGKLSLNTPTARSLPGWLRRMLPQALDFRSGKIDGWLDYRRPAGLTIQANASGSTATLYGQTLSDPRVSLNASSDEVRLGIQGGRWYGTPVRGAMMIGLKRPTLSGAIVADSVDLALLGRRFGHSGLRGRATVSALIGGTRDAPTSILEARGSGSYSESGNVVSAKFDAAGRYLPGQVKIDQLNVTSDAGDARAVGTITLKGQRLKLNVDANNIQLRKLREDLRGTLDASGGLTGTVSQPYFEGKALALGVGTNETNLAFASADVRANRESLRADNLQVFRGSTAAKGTAWLTFKDLSLGGSLHTTSGILLNEYLGDQFLGVIDIPTLTLGGTLKAPVIAGSGSGKDLLLGGVQVDSAEVESSLEGTVARIRKFAMKIGAGSVDVAGDYDYATQAGKFAVSAIGIPLDRLTPPEKGSANVTGTLNAKGTATILPPAFWRNRFQGPLIGQMEGDLKNVALNGQDFGSGSWKADFNGRDLSGSASIGQLDRFLLIENLNYNTKTEEIDAHASVMNADLKALYNSAKPFLKSLPFELSQKLDQASGDLDVSVGFSGALRDPSVDVTFLEARRLALQDQPLGQVNAQFNRRGELWTINQFNWTGPQGTLFVKPGATIDLDKNLDVDAELTNFDLRTIGLINSDWAQLQGLASLSLLAKGPSHSPTIQASLETARGSAVTFGGTGESFRMNLDTISVRESEMKPDGTYSGGVTASGKFFYRGLQGIVSARLPLQYPFTVPNGPPIVATIEFPDIDIKDLADARSALDIARSSGHLKGSITISGPRDDLGLAGSLTGQAQTLAMILRPQPGINEPPIAPIPVQTTLTSGLIDVELENRRITMKLSALGSEGGDFSANLGADLPDLKSAFQDILRGDTESLARTEVKGKIEAKDFAIKQDSTNKDFGNYNARINASLDVSGPAAEPLIKNTIHVSGTNVLLPSIFAGAGPGAEMLFNPRFEIPIELDGIARFRTGTADISMSGGGNLTGSLAEPNFSGVLTVENGRINLPTAKVTLEEGGTLRPSYIVGPDGESSARVDVNLEGRTAVTSVRYGGTVQRYDIRLFITGDLMSDSGLNLNATSDPPDLSKDEILGLLGQTDVLKSIGSGSGVSQSEAEARIRNALISIAVPQLTQGFTSQIASNLGLEYLNIEYNPVEGASLAFAKVLGKGLVLQGRRQVSPPVGNRKPDYELKLTYRLPSRNAALSRVVFSAGLDQDRPWKLGVEYGFRF